jgi:sugar fermentation stimulation protein A
VQFPDPLIPGRLIKRYKRFLADVTLDGGEVVTAHCANPGSMLSTDAPGSEVWLSPARNPERKLRYTWELIRVAGGALVSINTQHPNRVAEEAIAGGAIPELTGYATLRREVKYGKNSRIDILLEDGAKPSCLVEIKSVTMKRGNLCEFPDAVTARGAKHLDELAGQIADGHRAVMLYLAQRGDGEAFSIAGDIDPNYAEKLSHAMAAGVEAYCYECDVNPAGIQVAGPLAMRL